MLFLSRCLVPIIVIVLVLGLAVGVTKCHVARDDAVIIPVRSKCKHRLPVLGVGQPLGHENRGAVEVPVGLNREALLEIAHKWVFNIIGPVGSAVTQPIIGCGSSATAGC